MLVFLADSRCIRWLIGDGKIEEYQGGGGNCPVYGAQSNQASGRRIKRYVEPVWGDFDRYAWQIEYMLSIVCG
jgi:hypothetical protein